MSFDISGASVFVNEGDLLAIVLTTDVDGDYAWMASNFNEDPTDQYPDGEKFTRTQPSGTWTLAGISIDNGFKSYVMPIPESSTLTLASFGMSGLLAYPWRRRRRA